MILGSCPDLAYSTSKYSDLLPSSKCLPGHSLQRIQRHLLRNHLPHPNNELNLSLLTINVSLQPINTIKELCDELSLSQPGFANKVPNKIPVQLTEIVLEHLGLSFSCASEPSVLEVAGNSACRARIVPCLSRPFHQTLSCLSNPFPERKTHIFCTRKLIKHNSLSYFTKYGAH